MHHTPQHDPEQQRRLVIAVILSTLIMGLWYYFYQMPVQAAQREERHRVQMMQQEKLKQVAAENNVDVIPITAGTEAATKVKPEIVPSDVVKNSPRVHINNGRLHGSIRLIGARLDDITLANYKETLEKNSPEVALMSPSGSENSNFIDTGWIASDANIAVPDTNTLWKVESGAELTAATPVTLSWDNKQGQKFYITYSIDKDYMLGLTQRVENNSGADVTFYPFGLISKAERLEKENFILHTGPLGVMDGTLKEISYKDLRKNPQQVFDDSTGWIGITDKYWFKSLVPQSGEKYKATFRSTVNNGVERFQVDYLGAAKTAKAHGSIDYSARIFAGAKELRLLENYSKTQNLPLFERSIDFGWFYIITKPLYYVLISFYHHLGNFGLAIILLTFCVKLLLFPLARKSYISMGRMKQLQPKVQEMQKKYKGDKMEMQKHLMQLYKKEKVNPAAGCLPIVLQIPIFFSLYKVFFVSIEMRHAPFFGWIKDLSVKDPTSFVNLFGLLPFDPPSYLIIGFFPCLMAITMYIQQLLQPAPTDPVAAKMIRMMPLFFIVMFSSFPAGMIIYWCFSNTFTIMQQLYFLRRHPRRD